MAETLSGVIERVTFHNAETGFAVLRVQAKGRRDLVAVVGKTPSAVVGEYLEAVGSWSQDKEHGLQFKADELRTTPPHTVEGIRKYLGSGLIKGIGPHFAGKIVDVFGERTLDIIDESPSFLSEIKGIGPRRLQLIRKSWDEQKAVRGIMVFLQSHGIGTSRAVRIYRTYGDKSIELVRENPYRLATDIWGVGFQSADQLAKRIGIDRASPLRAQAAIRYVLQELSSDGHCGFPEQEVLERTTQLLGVSRDVVAPAIEREVAEGEIVRDMLVSEPCLYLKRLFLAETGVAEMIQQLSQGSHPLPSVSWQAALDWVEKKMGLELAATQREAVRQATMQKLLVITGGPGVGKTTIVRAILEIFEAKKLRCSLCAPTGRAAKRLGETTGRAAKTIHRLLEYDGGSGGPRRDRKNPLELDLLVIDEASMVDVVLMNHLLRAVPPGACVVLVGDVDQLPSVGPGAVLADIISSCAVPVVRLTEIFRQAGKSWIVQAAHQVHRGEIPESAPNNQGDFYFIQADSPGKILDRVLLLLRERIPERFRLDAVKDVQVLTPMNRSDLGARNLNEKLQEAFNPPQEAPEVQRHGWTFRQGDKVIQTVNNYDKEVFNGDVGRIKAIDLDVQELTVAYDDKSVLYDFNELDEIALAYALTIHKSQGSEYPAVVIPLHTQHYMLLQRNLLYTGITRGKKLVVVVGSRKALTLAVKREDTAKRFTMLCKRLQRA